MANWFISRHPGAIEWAKQQNLHIDHWVSHLNPAEVQTGDMVMGTLPIHLVAQICAKGARFQFLAMNLSAKQRGKELAASDMTKNSCSLIEYFAKKL